MNSPLSPPEVPTPAVAPAAPAGTAYGPVLKRIWRVLVWLQAAGATAGVIFGLVLASGTINSNDSEYAAFSLIIGGLLAILAAASLVWSIAMIVALRRNTVLAATMGLIQGLFLLVLPLQRLAGGDMADLRNWLITVVALGWLALSATYRSWPAPSVRPFKRS